MRCMAFFSFSAFPESLLSVDSCFGWLAASGATSTADVVGMSCGNGGVSVSCACLLRFLFWRWVSYEVAAVSTVLASCCCWHGFMLSFCSCTFVPLLRRSMLPCEHCQSSRLHTHELSRFLPPPSVQARTGRHFAHLLPAHGHHRPRAQQRPRGAEGAGRETNCG